LFKTLKQEWIDLSIRSPIVAVLGHVDHGKTLLLDKVRGTTIADKEAGKITQHVGASFIPTETIQKRCGKLLEKYNFKLTIPGLLFIDTPGHEAFTNLRKRGGSIADLAVLIIDATQGIQAQTKEAIEILKTYKTPFIVAANKIDLINGWIPNPNSCSLDTMKKQRDFVQQHLDEKIYKIIGQLGEMGFNSDRFDRITELTENIIIVPTSAKTGEGLPELLMFLAGLSQKYMEQKLHIDQESPGKGTVLEVKEIKGLGITIDVILYEGCIKQGDTIAVAGKNGVIITKARGVLQPEPLEEIRDPRKTFKSIKKVYAAAGVKIAAPGLEEALSGSPFIVVENEEKAKQEIEKELETFKIEKETTGTIIKTDALGSLEAIVNLLSKTEIPIKKADVGQVTKKDVLEADSIRKENIYLGVIFAFNTKVSEDAQEEAAKLKIPIFQSDIIYRLEEEYEEWKKQEETKEKKERLTKYIYPAKLKILPGCVFRASRPAVVGVEVIQGIIKQKYPLMNEDGKPIGKIQSIQDSNKTVEKAEKGMQVAISIEGATVGKNIYENQEIFTDIPTSQIYELIEKVEEKELIKQIKRIKGV